HRPRPVLHGRKLQSQERPADHGQHRARADRDRPQWQPHQRRDAPPGHGARRRDLSVELGHRGDPPSSRPGTGGPARGPDRPRARPGERRLLAPDPHARPDSILWGRNVHTVRKALGRQLAREHPAEADIVIPVPDSGTSAALGYSEESGTPYELGLIRNHYVGRTFIEPKQGIRHFGVKVKLNPMREMLASSHVPEEIRRYLAADSLGYLSLEGMLKATGADPSHFCHACFTGDYRVGMEPEATDQLRLFDG